MAKKKPRSTAAVAPKATVFVLCDSVSRDPNTGKPTLYGLFDIVRSPEFPFRYKSFAVYAKLTGKGTHPISIHLVGPRGQSEKLGEAEVKIPPGATAVLQADLIGAEFERPGTHELVLRSGRKIVGRTSFNVKRVPAAKREK